MPMLDRKQEAWPSLADVPPLTPGRDEKHPPAEEFPPIKAVLDKFCGATESKRITTEGFATEMYAGQYRLVVAKSQLLDVLTFLKTDPATAFDFLIDVIGVDYLHFRGARHRFGVIYALLSHVHNRRLWVKVFVDEPNLKLPTVYDLWNAADWMEREVYDMFGITFEGHPDLRRILLPKEFADFPLRKDYPLTGRGERHDFLTVDSSVV